MRQRLLLILSLLIAQLLPNEATAQDGYTYTLVHNGGYDFTIQAVPNASSNTFATSVQSYGFTILLPDGVTATLTSSLGNGGSATFFDGTNVGVPTVDGYLITETLGSPIALPAPSATTNTNMISLTVNGSPTSGELRILENNSALATTVTALKSFMSADMVDDGMALFPNVVDPNGPAVSGMSSFDFSVLGITESTLDEFSVFPNPVRDELYISGHRPLDKIEIYNSIGQLVGTKSEELSMVSVSDLETGVYFITLFTDSAQKTFKFVKN